MEDDELEDDELPVDFGADAGGVDDAAGAADGVADDVDEEDEEDDPDSDDFEVPRESVR